MNRISWLVLAALIAGGEGMAAAEPSVLLTGSSHLSYTNLRGEAGAAADLVFATGFRPWPFLAVGLEGGMLTPLKVGRSTGKEMDLALRVSPTVWLIYGDDIRWSYLKLGVGVDRQWWQEGAETAGVLLGAFGFTVAPEDLLVYFGLELQGQWEALGERSNRFLGLGALMGYRF